MTRAFPAILLAFMLAPATAWAYDPAPDEAAITMLRERIDGDVNGGLLPNDRAALLRVEIDTAQRFVSNGDSQATAMLADIDRDLAAYDDNLGLAEADHDRLVHLGDTVVIAMRDGANWQLRVSNPDVIDVKSPPALDPPGVQGTYLAKSPGYAAIVLTDPASNRHVRFRLYVVERAPASHE